MKRVVKENDSHFIIKKVIVEKYVYKKISEIDIKLNSDLCNHKFGESLEKQVDHDHFKKIILKDKIS